MSHPPIINDVVLSPFGATVPEMVEAAQCAEESGFGAVYTYDHLTGVMLDRGASHDAFVTLAAIAAGTERVRIGTLVANMMNRHPTRLALAMSSLQSISGGRAVLGLGAGSSPGSRFAQEQEIIGIELLDAVGRSRRLIETVALIRATWAGAKSFDGEFFKVEEPGLELDEPNPPPIIFGASGEKTIKLALEHADGVNITSRTKLDELIRFVADNSLNDDFEVSVHQPVEIDHPTGGEMTTAMAEHLHRRVLAWNAPFDLDAMTRLGATLSE